MPYNNVPKPMWGKMDRCVEDVMKTGKPKDAAIAICHSSLMKEVKEDDVSRQDRSRAKARRAERELQVVKDIADLAQLVIADDAPDEPSATAPADPPPAMLTVEQMRALERPAAAAAEIVSEKAAYPWDQCIADQMKRYGSKARAEKICGAIRAQGKEWGGSDVEYKALESSFGIVLGADESLDDLRARIGNAFRAQYGNPPASSPAFATDPWVAEYYPDYLIVNDGGASYRVDFSDTDGVLTFAPRTEWQKVQKITLWEPTNKAQKEVSAAAQLDEKKLDQMAAQIKQWLEKPVETKALIAKTEVMKRAAEAEAQAGKSADELLTEIIAEQDKAAPAPDKPAGARALLARVKAMFAPKPASLASFSLTKDAKGNMRWLMIASNNRRDRDRPAQIITEAAHKEFAQFLDANPDKAPDAWLWHTPGTAWGKADWWDYSDGFMVYSGTVNPGMEDVAQRLAERKDLGVSHGMLVKGYDPQDDLITQYRTFELSPLPATRAANEWTSYHAIAKEVSALFTEEKRKYLAALLGEDRVKELEKGTAGAKEVLDAIGVESKEAPVEPAKGKAMPPQLADAAKKKPAADATGTDSAPATQPAAAAPDMPGQAMMAAGDQPAADTAAADAAEADAEAADAQKFDALQTTVAALVDQVGLLTDKVTALLGKQQSADMAIKELKVSKDAELAWLIRPRIGPETAGYRASVAPDTVLRDDNEADKALKSVQPSTTAAWFAQQVVGRLGQDA